MTTFTRTRATMSWKETKKRAIRASDSFPSNRSRQMSLHASPVITWNIVNMEEKKSPKRSGWTWLKKVTLMMAYIAVTRQTSANALAIGGMEAESATMICRSDGMRLKRRKTRKHRMSLKTWAPGRSSMLRDRRDTSTTTRSNQFHPSDMNSEKKVAKRLMTSSMVKMTVKARLHWSNTTSRVSVFLPLKCDSMMLVRKLSMIRAATNTWQRSPM
mmetsp:Transcript_35852/g.91591  ORF Transcript_35852/g.91591 Transcript_35852/m.91591 type:complete len:215 (-) Transcript_35852:921-1565(-)